MSVAPSDSSEALGPSRDVRRDSGVASRGTQHKGAGRASDALGELQIPTQLAGDHGICLAQSPTRCSRLTPNATQEDSGFGSGQYPTCISKRAPSAPPFSSGEVSFLCLPPHTHTHTHTHTVPGLGQKHTGPRGSEQMSLASWGRHRVAGAGGTSQPPQGSRKPSTFWEGDGNRDIPASTGKEITLGSKVNWMQS